MGKFCTNSKRGFSNLLYWILLLFFTTVQGPAMAATSSNNTVSDYLALLDFKNLITQDPLQIMSSWNNSVSFCSWTGVSCSPDSGRGVTLELESLRLAGSVPPSIGNLTFLTGINLRNNRFHGELPEEIGRLQHLQHVNLTYNSFAGKIPTDITNCLDLRVFAVAGNNFIGEIPHQLSLLTKLVILELGANNLTGIIPSWIGNFSSLFGLSLAVNSFHGSVPVELGKLSNLGFINIYGNYLSGTIPSSLYNISSIYYFSFAQNQLRGQLPPGVGLTLPNLEVFAGGVNNFTGQIPISLSNASGLQVLDFAENGLTGAVPKNLGSLQSLYRFNFDNNLLENGIGDWDFLSALANCTSLEVLGLGYNQFGGEMPNVIGNLSTQLQRLTIGGNLIYGNIPIGIENLINLTSLGLEYNQLTGSVPDGIGKLQKLEGLYVNYNRLSGLIPSALGNLTALTRLFMEGNQLEGRIPPSLGNCKRLQNLNLSTNHLNGSIPKEVIGLSSLSISLVLSRNLLTGPLPLEVGKLVQLMDLDLSENSLSGEIPSTLGSCISLQRLSLEGNTFEGAIPESLKTLRGIEELDLSHNNLSGNIPGFLAGLSSLKLLNLSYNDFVGEVPIAGIFANASAFSIIGNHKVCGGSPKLLLASCSSKGKGKTLPLKAVILATMGAVFLAISLYLVVILLMARSSRRNAKAAPPDEFQGDLSYAELVRATDGFASEHLIGSGSFGSVYKGVLSGDGRTVAIKVLNLQQHGASKSFVDECTALRSIRHHNLLKVITACSTIDHQGNDFKCLVFEFMSHGNLDEWLHPTASEQCQAKRLSLIRRLDIAIDVAAALDYLHHHCETPIVHCDLKPSNVLLDEDMTAHVSDFGLARFLFEATKNPSRNQEVTVGLKGSVGYIPPEYGMGGQVSTLGDVYSYGILLLEMFTGKRPTDDMFTDDLSIRKFVEMALPDRVMDIIDPSVFDVDEEDDNDRMENGVEEKAMIKHNNFSGNQGDGKGSLEECLVSVLDIGLSCCARSRGNRMAMNSTVNKLLGIRDSFLKSNSWNRRAMQ